ncbi:MerR family transcriptional regulator [Candidatus Uhrbacteria bacterium]|nr:MerR family transcriptional regulator [Candidatus Uhrbacteria bacterium]
MAKKTLSKLFIPRSDAFAFDLADYQFNDKFQKVRELMNDRRFTVGETDVAYRVINHWDQSGLLPDGVRGDGSWRKFTLPEMVWLKAVVRMRDFGLPLEKIAYARKGAMSWNKQRERYPCFEYYLAKAWLSDADTYILVMSDGEAEVATVAQIEAAKLFLDSFDVLLISLKAILKGMGLHTPAVKTLFALSEKDIELLTSIHMGNNNDIKVKIDDQGEITEIESTETTTSPLAPHRLKNQVEQEKMYGQVVTKYENGVPKSVQVTTRKRLK